MEKSCQKNQIGEDDDISTFPSIVKALRHRNYLIFFCGNFFSLIGTWMQNIGQSWLVYRLTNSEWLLGIVGFSSQLPSLFLAPLGGVIADRCNRRRALVLTQFLAAIQALVLAGLTISQTVTIGQIILLGTLLGVINAFDMPLRQSFMPELVEGKEDLPNAIALNSLLFNSARLIGPSIAGILIACYGEGFCFLVNGLSYGGVLTSLLMLKLYQPPAASGRPKIRTELKEGISYCWRSLPIRSLLLMTSLISLVGMSYGVLLPVFAGEILQGGPATLGFLMAAAGAGALGGGIYLASRKSVQGLALAINLAPMIFGASLMLLSLCRVTWLAALLLVFMGCGMVTQMAASNTILQTITEDSKRGRVMSLFTMSFIGVMPLGSLLAGWLASEVGTPAALLAGGVLCVGGGYLFSRKRRLINELLARSP